LTQPDRPAGRGQRSFASAVKGLAVEQGLEVLQPASLREGQLIERLRAVGADAMVVAAYGLLLPPALLEVARHGAINIHASLLPRWRGAAPIQRAVLAGDTETGVSIMQMDAGLDTGPLFAQRRVPIAPDDDFGTLHDRLAALGADALIEVLAALPQARERARPQPQSGGSYAPKIDKAETWLRWERPASELERAVRAFRPAPGANARFAGGAIKVWRSRVVEGRGAAGTVLESTRALHVACGDQALALEELQPAGGRRMPAADFLRGHRIARDARFE
jgi:methionyl-tRNA formyltransferase